MDGQGAPDVVARFSAFFRGGGQRGFRGGVLMAVRGLGVVGGCRRAGAFAPWADRSRGGAGLARGLAQTPGGAWPTLLRKGCRGAGWRPGRRRTGACQLVAARAAVRHNRSPVGGAGGAERIRGYFTPRGSAGKTDKRACRWGDLGGAAAPPVFIRAGRPGAWDLHAGVLRSNHPVCAVPAPAGTPRLTATA